MTASPDRLRRLREAGFLAKVGPGCRLCRGRTLMAGQPYCRRHFNNLRGSSELLTHVAEGTHLDDADLYIRLREQVPSVRYVATHHVELGGGLTLRVSSGSSAGRLWVLRRRPAMGEEQTLGRYRTMSEAIAAVVQIRHLRTAHNTYAKKALIG